MGKFRTSYLSQSEFHEDHHRFEHWYRDNTVYFITARCRDRENAFASEEAKQSFWECFPWVTSLLDNHYHNLGYLKIGENRGPMMQRIHGSVAKLVNDTLEVRLRPFWYDTGKQGYFDGCIRDVLQAMRAYRYTLLQGVRHGIVRDHREYRHTRVNVEQDRAIRRAVELQAFMEDVPYARYERKYSRR